MKKFNYIYIVAIASIVFAGCYTQVATDDGVYTRKVTSEVYTGNQQNAQAGRDVYTDTSENYSGEYYDTTGYFDSSRPDGYYNYDYEGGYNSYYYDDFYYSYPSYSRYFWGYYPSISIGFSWPGWYYSPFYFSFGFGWYYPYYPYWGYSCFSYYYPAPYYCGYNYCYNGWYYPKYPYYYTSRDRRRDITRIRNLDGLRGSGGRGDLISSRDRSSVNRITDRNLESTTISPASRSSKTARLQPERNNRGTDKEATKTSRNINEQISRRPAERKSVKADGNLGETLTRTEKRKVTDRNTAGRTVPSERSKIAPEKEKRNEGRSSNGNIRPQSYPTPSVEYKPQRRPNTRGNYTPPKRSTIPKNYTPPKRNNTPKSYAPPKRNNTTRSYTPPTRNSTPRSYSPPQRSSSPPARSSGSRSGGSSSGRSRK